MNSTVDERYLRPTAIIDSDHPGVLEQATKAARNIRDPVEKAVRIYYLVRDAIWYDPYSPFFLPEHYRASSVLKRGRGFCVPKASLLCAMGRALSIPSRVGFATVRNHLATRQLIESMGSDRFVYHGYTEFFLGGKWVKATPAFNAALCERHQVAPLEFDGHTDSVFQPFNLEQRQFMEYVADHGSHSDIPVATIVAAWKEAYGEARVLGWIARLENLTGETQSDFTSEEVWKGR
jgi:transglutaminase-like putative cysteine protease